MSDTIYQKTPAGQREIQSRQLRLQPRLRSLLVLIDGKTSAAKQLEALSGLGVTQQAFDELLGQGLIASLDGSAAAAISETQTEPSPPQEYSAQEAFEVTETASTVGEDERTRKSRALYTFFNEAIKENLGLRGFMLQLQVEKAATLDDYAEIRASFLAAVRKSKGDALATQLGRRIEAILSGG